MAKVPEHPEEAKEAAERLGFKNWQDRPTEDTEVLDLLLHALAPYGKDRPDLDIVLGVAAELDTLAMFMEGPLSITLELLARRLRLAVDLAGRMPPPTATPISP